MLEGARKFEFPEELLEGDPDGVLLCIPVPVVPYFRRFFAQVQSPYIWKTREDFERAYPIFTEIEAQMSASCVSKIVEANDRIYRLLDTALNGTEYSVVPPVAPATESTVTPALPLAPAYQSPHQLAPPDNYGLRTRLERLINLTDNVVTGGQTGSNPALSTSSLQDSEGLRRTIREMQGILDAGWFGIGGQDATIADVVEALRIGSGSDRTMIDDALDALGAAANVASIFAVVKDTLRQGAQMTMEGGVLAVLIVSTLANLTAQAQNETLLRRIIAALDGGGLMPPEDSVLERLRTVDQNIADIETMVS